MQIQGLSRDREGRRPEFPKNQPKSWGSSTLHRTQSYLGSRTGVSNYSLWTKFSLPPVFVNKVLLECPSVYIFSMAAFTPKQ